MALSAEATVRRVRDTLAPRGAALVVAMTVIALGLYPAPLLILIRSETWRSDAVVTRLTDERAFWVAGLLTIVGPAAVLANLIPAGFDRVWNGLRARIASVSDRGFVAGAALFATLVAAAASVYVFARKPTTSDEVAQLWHARILLSGHLSLPADPNPEFFAIDNVVDQGRWYSQFPVGWPAWLALATLLHVTWLLNPILAGLTVMNVYRFALRVYGRATAQVAAVLCAVCPFVLLMSASYMNHTAVAFLGTLALAEMPVVLDGDVRRRMLAAVLFGLSLGIAITIRPLDGAVAAITLGFAIIIAGIRRARVRALLVAIAAGALPIAGLLIVNALTTGSPWRFGYEVLWGANHSLGFHPDPTGNPHTPARALALATLYLLQLNWSLFEWPFAGLLIVAGALLIARPGRWELLLVAWIGVQLAAYAAYWHAGNFMGPRYLFTVVPACLTLVARGLTRAHEVAPPMLRRGLAAGVGASLLGAWMIPATPVGAVGTAKSVRPTRLAFKRDLGPALSSINGTKALVFVGETASSRLMRRMWGLGISRPDAARLAATKDNCALLDAVLDEESTTASAAEHLSRLERAKNYAPPPGWRLLVEDGAFRTSDRESITPRCRSELLLDRERLAALSYGAALLENTIGRDGHIDGSIILVADLAEHNEVLRSRFADRTWYRLSINPADTGGEPELVPYAKPVAPTANGVR